MSWRSIVIIIVFDNWYRMMKERKAWTPEGSSTSHTEQVTKRVGTRPGCEVTPLGIKSSTRATCTMLEKSLLPTDIFPFSSHMTQSPRTVPLATSSGSPVPHSTWLHYPPHRSCSHGQAPASGLYTCCPFHLESLSLRCLCDMLLHFLQVAACVPLLTNPYKRATAIPFPPHYLPYSPYHHMTQHICIFSHVFTLFSSPGM